MRNGKETDYAINEMVGSNTNPSIIAMMMCQFFNKNRLVFVLSCFVLVYYFKKVYIKIGKRKDCRLENHIYNFTC